MFRITGRFDNSAGQDPFTNLGWEQLPLDCRSQMENLFTFVPELRELVQEGIQKFDWDRAWGLWLGKIDDQGISDRGVAAQACMDFGKTSGLLRKYSFNNPEWAELELPTPELVRAKAREFVQVLLGDWLKDYRMEEEVNYSGMGTKDHEGRDIRWQYGGVRFVPLYNGIPLMNSPGVLVQVNSLGRVVSFTWTAGIDEFELDKGVDESLFPDPALAISLEQASALREQNLVMALEYHQEFLSPLSLWGRQNENSPSVLRYNPVEGSGKPLEGMTGEPVDFHDGEVSRVSFTACLTGQARNWVVKNQQDAEVFLRELEVDVSGLAFAEGVGKHPFQAELRMDMYSWGDLHKSHGRDAGGPEVLQVDLHVDPVSGKFFGFQRILAPDVQREAAITEEAARARAMGLVADYLIPAGMEIQLWAESIEYPIKHPVPEWYDPKNPRWNENTAKSYTYRFYQIHQGIPVMVQALLVELDGDGRLTGLGFGDFAENPGPLTDPSQAISLEVAKGEYIKNHPLQLVYYWPSYKRQKAPAPRLMYHSEQGPGYVDAIRGN